MFWIIVPLVILTGESRAESYVSTQVGGNDAKVETSITTSVNGQTSQVTSSQPGDINVTNINGHVQVETSEGVTPTISTPAVTAHPLTIGRKTVLIKQKIITWLNSFWKRLRTWWL